MSSTPESPAGVSKFKERRKEVLVVPGGVPGSVTREATLPLTAGFHDITVEYYEALGPPELSLNYAPPGQKMHPVPFESLTHIQTVQTDAEGILALPATPGWMQELQVIKRGTTGERRATVDLSRDRITAILNLRETK